LADVALQASDRSDEDAIFVPEKSAPEWGVASLLFAFSVLFLWPFGDFTILFPDEGITLQGAQRILHGQVLYRDFFTFYTPGCYYWTALRFKLLGSSFFAARVALLLYGGMFSVCLYMLARRLCTRKVAALTAYLFLAIGLPYRFLVLHNWDSTVLAVLALYASVRWMETSQRLWAFAAGTLVSLTCLFEQSKGAGLIAGLGLGFLLIARYGRRPAVFRQANATAVLVGMAWPLIITFGYLISQHCLPQAIEDWLWPLRHYSLANRLRYGYIPISFEGSAMLYASGSVLRTLLFMSLTSPFFIVPFLPFLGLALLILKVSRAMRESRLSAKDSFCVLVSACGLGLALGVVATGRPDVDHLIYVAPPLILLLGMVSSGRVVKSWLLTEVQPLLLAFLMVTFTAFGMVFLLSGPRSAEQSLETRRGRIRLPCCDTVIPYLQRHVQAGEQIFVYPYQPLYYFLTATSSPTGLDYLQLGLHSEGQIEEMLNQLAAHSPKCVVWAPSFNTQIITGAWPATPQQVLSKDIIRDFILARYQPCAMLTSGHDPYIFLVRKDSACPN
jgi:4-amino-4-deoxy-L-arabinose transferase-like glycosyltransferase